MAADAPEPGPAVAHHARVDLGEQCRDRFGNGRTFVTGSFAQEYAQEYAQTTAALKATAVSEQAIVVVAEVSATGVVSASADRVELLLYLNQDRRNVNTTGEKVDQNCIVITMVPVRGEWKVVGATAI